LVGATRNTLRAAAGIHPRGIRDEKSITRQTLAFNDMTCAHARRRRPVDPETQRVRDAAHGDGLRGAREFTHSATPRMLKSHDLAACARTSTNNWNDCSRNPFISFIAGLSRSREFTHQWIHSPKKPCR
jgi:hypothetical protein